MHSIKWWHCRWPWMAPNLSNHLNFYILQCLSYLCSGWTQRLQIWCTGWS